MADNINDSLNKTPRFREAYERLAAEIQAVPEGELMPIILDIQSTVATVLGAWKEIRGFRADFVSGLPSFDIALFDRLESYALALGHTHTVYQTANEPPATLVLLAGEVGKTREILVANVSLLMALGLLGATVLSELKGTNGYKNLAFDVFALSNILKKNWSRVSSKLTLTIAELDAAENAADRLVTAVGEREQAPAVAAQTTRERQAAFVLLSKAYEEVRAALGFLRRKQGDAESIAPSLYAARAAARKSNSDPAEKDKEKDKNALAANAAHVAEAQGQAKASVAGASETKTSNGAVEAVGPYAL